MGTEITLDVAGMSVTYSKNHRGIDHGSIFQEQDRKAMKSDQLDCDWYEEEGEDPTPSEMAFTRPLKHVVPRLELLGFNLERVRREYDAVAQNWLEERRSLQDDEDEPIPDLMSFAEFLSFATAHPLDGLDDTFVSGSDDASFEVASRGRSLTGYPTGDPTISKPIRSGVSSARWWASSIPIRFCGSWQRRRRTRTLQWCGSTDRWCRLVGQQSGSSCPTPGQARRF